MDRRTVLASVSTLAGSGVLAGCFSGGSAGDGDTNDEEERCNVDPPPRECEEMAITEEFADVENFDGIVDRTDVETVTIDVGVKNGAEHVGFGPPVVRVTEGTRIVWRWTGNGGKHDVVAESNHDVESELTDRDGHTYEYHYEGSMSKVDLEYYCSNHRADGMRGLILNDARSTM